MSLVFILEIFRTMPIFYFAKKIFLSPLQLQRTRKLQVTGLSHFVFIVEATRLIFKSQDRNLTLGLGSWVSWHLFRLKPDYGVSGQP